MPQTQLLCRDTNVLMTHPALRSLKADPQNRLLPGRKAVPSFLLSITSRPLFSRSPQERFAELLLAERTGVSLFLEWKGEIGGKFPLFWLLVGL